MTATVAKSRRKFLNWAKTPPTCSINMPRLDPVSIPCHFIHSQPFLTKSGWLEEKASRVRLRANHEKCFQIVLKPRPHAPLTSLDFILTWAFHPFVALSDKINSMAERDLIRRGMTDEDEARKHADGCGIFTQLTTFICKTLELS